MTPFEGELVRLRAREPADEPLIHQWFNDPEVTQHLTIRYPLSHAAERRYLEATSDPGYSGLDLAVVRKSDNQLIGSVALRQTSPENRSADLGITIGDKSSWDGGYGTDTMRTICRFGFTMMNLHRIELTVYAENERAMHVYKKIGFREEGRLRDAVYKYGHYIDVVMMGLLEGELR